MQPDQFMLIVESKNRTEGGGVLSAERETGIRLIYIDLGVITFTEGSNVCPRCNNTVRHHIRGVGRRELANSQSELLMNEMGFFDETT